MTSKSVTFGNDEELCQPPTADESTCLLPKDEANENVTFTVPRWVVLSALSLLLIGIGTFSVMQIEGWRFVTSLYVIVQIATTIGYGDFTVTSDAMKLYCAFYVLIVLIFLSYALNLAVSWMHDVSMAKMRETLRGAECFAWKASHYHDESGVTSKEVAKQVKAKYGKYNELVVASLLAIFAIAFGTVFYATYESCTCSYGKSAVDGCKEDTHEVCIATGGYKKTWVTSFYMSVITLTTVGFGDHSPRSEVGRAVGIIWMLVGVGFTANWLAVLTKVFVEAERESLMIHSNISPKLFKKMDTHGNGHLSRSEFSRYFLVKNGLVSEEDLKLIDEHYEHLGRNDDGRVTLEVLEKHLQRERTMRASGFL